ncbi:MAG: hypothetical protein KBH99_08975 [Syntrophobacteraceae bacterium]|nr:hypothetical protein [Syntrophobacteraceae bacterium]
MKIEKLYHKCGHAIIYAKETIFPATKTFFIDGEDPFTDDGDGSKKPRVLQKCPACGGFIRIERLLSQKPEIQEDRRTSGYIPAGK